MKSVLMILVIVLPLTSCSFLKDEHSSAGSSLETSEPKITWAQSGSQDTKDLEKVTSAAYASHDPKPCESLWSSSQNCFDSYWRMEAMYSFNPLACRRISDSEKAASCRTGSIAYVTAYATTPQQCRRIPDSSVRTDCLDRLALKATETEDSSACETLRTETMKRSCMDSKLYQMARSGTGGALVCRRISNASVRSACEQIAVVH